MILKKAVFERCYEQKLFTWVTVYLEACFGCHDIPMLGKSSIKWRQCPNMTIAVDWDVNIKQKGEVDSK